MKLFQMAYLRNLLEKIKISFNRGRLGTILRNKLKLINTETNYIKVNSKFSRLREENCFKEFAMISGHAYGRKSFLTK